MCLLDVLEHVSGINVYWWKCRDILLAYGEIKNWPGVYLVLFDIDVFHTVVLQAGDICSLVRVHCYQKDFDAAAEVVSSSGNAAGAFQLAREVFSNKITLGI